MILFGPTPILFSTLSSSIRSNSILFYSIHFFSGFMRSYSLQYNTNNSYLILLGNIIINPMLFYPIWIYLVVFDPIGPIRYNWILFYPIRSCLIIFGPIRSHSIPISFYSILLYSVCPNSILSDSFTFYSILFGAILVSSHIVLSCFALSCISTCRTFFFL